MKERKKEEERKEEKKKGREEGRREEKKRKRKQTNPQWIAILLEPSVLVKVRQTLSKMFHIISYL